ncbi:hypothetical protein [Asticcacaulis sp.]|uniref:hypothetical protein n=1 Tax=Asticcacaulis sp. TaxID=1872648 RepID=UPI0031E18ADE
MNYIFSQEEDRGAGGGNGREDGVLNSHTLEEVVHATTLSEAISFWRAGLPS